MRISDWSSDVCSSDLGIPLAGTVGVDASQIGAFRESVARLDPPWVSEHLAFLRAGRGRQAFNTGFLLPPLQSRETIETSVRNIRQLQAAIGRPLAFEIAANYLKPLPGEMTDGAFIAEIAERADCRSEERRVGHEWVNKCRSWWLR